MPSHHPRKRARADGQSRQPIDVNPHAFRANRPADSNLTNFQRNWPLYKEGRLVVLLGAGASIGARGGTANLESKQRGDLPELPLAPFPSAVVLRDEIWRRFMRPEGERPEKFDVDKELGTMSLDQASAFASASAGRWELVKFIAARFHARKPLWQHAVLPFLGPTAVFTTNYDLLIEHGWSLHASSAKIGNLTAIFAGDQTVSPAFVPLFKPHGSVDRVHEPVGMGGPVITTPDYFKMLIAKRRMLEEWLGHLRGVCVLLIGYSMSDMDVGGHLYHSRQTSNGNIWYAVFPRSDPTVRRYWANELRIEQIDRTFVEFMADLDDEVNFIPKEWKFDRIATKKKFIQSE